MKVLKTGIKDTFIDSLACDRNFSHNPFLLLGNEPESTTQIIMAIDTIRIYELWSRYRVTKVELCMFLKDIRYCSNKNHFILNIRENRSDVNISRVTYNTAPRVSRIKHRYRISNMCIGKYVYFDITEIVRNWFDTRGCDYSITISAEEENYLLAFQSTRNRMKPFLRVYYKKNSCRKKESDITSRERYLNDFGRHRERDNRYSDDFYEDRYRCRKRENECNNYYEENTDNCSRYSNEEREDFYDLSMYKKDNEVYDYDDDNRYTDDGPIESNDSDNTDNTDNTDKNVKDEIYNDDIWELD